MFRLSPTLSRLNFNLENDRSEIIEMIRSYSDIFQNVSIKFGICEKVPSSFFFHFRSVSSRGTYSNVFGVKRKRANRRAERNITAPHFPSVLAKTRGALKHSFSGSSLSRLAEIRRRFSQDGEYHSTSARMNISAVLSRLFRAVSQEKMSAAIEMFNSIGRRRGGFAEICFPSSCER